MSFFGLSHVFIPKSSLSSQASPGSAHIPLPRCPVSRAGSPRPAPSPRWRNDHRRGCHRSVGCHRACERSGSPWDNGAGRLELLNFLGLCHQADDCLHVLAKAKGWVKHFRKFMEARVVVGVLCLFCSFVSNLLLRCNSCGCYTVPSEWSIITIIQPRYRGLQPTTMGCTPAHSSDSSPRAQRGGARSIEAESRIKCHGNHINPKKNMDYHAIST